MVIFSPSWVTDDDGYWEYSHISHNTRTFKMSSLNDQTNNLGSGLTSLTFAEFTWDNGNGGYKMISSSNLGKLYHYMRTHYPGDNVSPPEIMGGFLGNLEIQLEIGGDHVEDLRLYHIPKTYTLWKLMREGFPDALAVSFIDNEIFVELPELSRYEHAERLKRCPGWFAHEGPKLFYYNGIRIKTQRSKEVGRLGRQGREGKLLGSDMLRMDDVYMVDDDAMGYHTAMLCKGITVISQPDQDKVAMEIFAMSDPVAYGEPSIRAGCCGSALVRMDRSTEAEGGLLEKGGEIGLFIVGSKFGEGKGADDFPRVLCFAEANDRVIEAGLEVE
ncbi:hypothetical protein VE01_07959 [Pseudogymnoascus verrucosus]|uniref:Uncharacterized protein n=1 Tax=Pseudogymnoascus verrucosus TaxID=342668 RepID=A0A1B8GFG3_9PEZI|nr:uncharacterized protein VE01_07959 [Pseudogymnoascus verrucosus]OBT94543.2 hypothetical protein VE01_07959 [Pseudogymnoascus verrucosus]